jgi:nucleotide-binding universal stress UspA family protein
MEADKVMEADKKVIVVGVDCSAASERALEWALDEAMRRDCPLRVVTAWSGYGMEAVGAVSSPSEAQERAEAVLDRVVDAAVAKVKNPPQIERLVVEDTPSHALTMASLDADLLVLGSHGHGGAYDKIVGSTSQRVLHHAVCPAVILPDPRCAQKTLKRAGALHDRMEAPEPTLTS